VKTQEDKKKFKKLESSHTVQTSVKVFMAFPWLTTGNAIVNKESLKKTTGSG